MTECLACQCHPFVAIAFRCMLLGPRLWLAPLHVLIWSPVHALTYGSIHRHIFPSVVILSALSTQLCIACHIVLTDIPHLWEMRFPFLLLRLLIDYS